MMNMRILSLSAVLAALLIAVWLFGPLTPLGTSPVAFAALDCTDGVDNDGDSSIDEDGVPCDATLTGTVQYQNGTAISGASVAVTDVDTSATYTSGTTDSSGNFSFSLTTGTFTVTASYGVASSATSSAVSITASSTTALSSALTVGQTAWAYCDSTITDDCVESVTGPSGSVPSSTLRLVPAVVSGQLQLQFLGVTAGSTNDEFGRPLSELGDFGVTTSDSYTFKVRLKTFVAKGLMGTANLDTWSYDSSTKLLTIVAKPLAASYPISPNVCDPTTCVEQADIDFDALMYLFVSDFSDVPAQFADIVEDFVGMYINVNSNYFTMPAPDTNTSQATSFSLGAPHLKKSGVVNTGFFKLFTPANSLQNHFGISGLTGVQFAVKITSGGITTTSTLSATAGTNGAISGVILENTGFNYSVNDFQLTSAVPESGDDDSSDPDPAFHAAIVAGLDDTRSLENSLELVLGTDVQVLSNSTKLVTGKALGEPVRVPLPVVGSLEGSLAGELNFTLDNLMVQTEDGQTKATIDFGGGMTVISTMVELMGDGTIDLVLAEPKLNFQPTVPDIRTLAGGDPTVTQIGASFALDFKALPEGASLHAEFAKDITAILADPTAKFAQLADSLQAQMGDLANDVAFGVAVQKSGIANDDLGDNKVTLEVSREWFDWKISQGKAVLIAKFDDAGIPIPPPVDVTGTCSTNGDSVSCNADFTGTQGGLSVFALVAMTLPPAPAPAPASAPTAILERPADTTTVVAPLVEAGNLIRIWHFDSAAQAVPPNYGWTYYVPGPEWAVLNSLEEMVEGQIYWINLKQDQTVILNGQERNLWKGWNLVAW